jgi:hypothetical protein
MLLCDQKNMLSSQLLVVSNYFFTMSCCDKLQLLLLKVLHWEKFTRVNFGIVMWSIFLF